MKVIDLRLRIYIAILLVVIVIGMIGLIVLEKFSPFDAFYLIISTISTVGFGDIHPTTTAGRFLIILIILTGVGCFVGVMANAIEYIIDERDRAKRLEKINMVIGVFFSEVGIPLLKKLSAKDPDISGIQNALIVTNNWSEDDFAQAMALLKKHVCRLDSRTISLPDLHEFFAQHKGFLVSLLENPEIGEHDTFTELLHSVFHLVEELMAREQLTDLPVTDYAHLSGDINRVYSHLVMEWLTYMHHLKKQYPYLFSLSMRTNPFDKNASPIVV
ncbi:MAG: potassium channel family protein [Methanoregulaceae archaeon]|jgi:hypothetical protein